MWDKLPETIEDRLTLEYWLIKEYTRTKGVSKRLYRIGGIRD